SIGLAVALGVCAIVVLELVRRLRRRTSRHVEEQVTATVETLEARLDELAQELSSAVRKAEEEAQRSRFLGQIAATIDLDDAIGSPLVSRRGAIGWLGIFSRDPDVRFGDDDLRRLEELAERVAPAIENSRRFREARQLADLDSLTGLHNRRYFYETLGREVDRAQRYQRRLSLVIVDVDGFKEINDRIGHLAGDAVLAEIVDRIRQVVRSADIPCRVGGDEFAVIVPEVEVGQARQLVGRIQRAMSAQPIARAGRVRVSAGVSDLQPNDSPTS